MSLLHWVWLGLALPPGSEKADQILAHFPDPEEFYQAGEHGIDEIPGLSEGDKTRILATTLTVAENAMESAEKFGAKIYSKADALYPKRLLNTSQSPPVIYVQGNIEGAGKALNIAVVGSRRASDSGRRCAKEISYELASLGVIIVSGLAAGIDTAAHTAALDAGGRTYAVQGCGVGSVYPLENAALKERIIASGAVISQFPPDALPQSGFFPIRNRVVSALSSGVLVIEAAVRSGTSITAGLAIEQGKDLFAVPGDIYKPNSQGTLELLKAGAIPVSNAGDILSTYARRFPDKVLYKGGGQAPDKARLRKEGSFPDIKKPLPEGVSEKAQKLYALLERNAKYVEELCALSGLSASDTAAALTELEIYGLAEHVPGRRFKLG